MLHDKAITVTSNNLGPLPYIPNLVSKLFACIVIYAFGMVQFTLALKKSALILALCLLKSDVILSTLYFPKLRISCKNIRNGAGGHEVALKETAQTIGNKMFRLDYTDSCLKYVAFVYRHQVMFSIPLGVDVTFMQ